MTEVAWNADTTSPEHNPLEKLPVLILDDGEAVFERDYILEWLEAKYPNLPLYPDNLDMRLIARRFEVVADGVCDAFVLHVFERMRDAEKQSQAWMNRQARKIEDGIRDLAAHVPPTGFYVGDTFTLADIAFVTVMEYLDRRYPEYEWFRLYPALADAVKRLADRLPLPFRCNHACPIIYIR